MSENVLRRFHGALVEALQRRGADHMERPFTVAEIYQDLVPYALYRETLGVEMNGDYEHALLRLLSGEEELVELESEAALREIRRELESTNPNTGLFREFAAVDARLNMSRVLDVAPLGLTGSLDPNGSEAGERENPMAGGGLDTEYGTEADGFQQVPLGAFATSGPLDPEMVQRGETPAPPPEESDSARVCHWCREALPLRDDLNFCPFCGIDATLVPCPSCGEALEAHWRFCITCGAKAPGAG